jgi:hypothetical protein
LKCFIEKKYYYLKTGLRKAHSIIRIKGKYSVLSIMKN